MKEQGKNTISHSGITDMRENGTVCSPKRETGGRDIKRGLKLDDPHKEEDKNAILMWLSSWTKTIKSRKTRNDERGRS